MRTSGRSFHAEGTANAKTLRWECSSLGRVEFERSIIHSSGTATKAVE